MRVKSPKSALSLGRLLPSVIKKEVFSIGLPSDDKDVPDEGRQEEEEGGRLNRGERSDSETRCAEARDISFSEHSGHGSETDDEEETATYDSETLSTASEGRGRTMTLDSETLNTVSEGRGRTMTLESYDTGASALKYQGAVCNVSQPWTVWKGEDSHDSTTVDSGIDIGSKRKESQTNGKAGTEKTSLSTRKQSNEGTEGTAKTETAYNDIEYGHSGSVCLTRHKTSLSSRKSTGLSTISSSQVSRDTTFGDNDETIIELRSIKQNIKAKASASDQGRSEAEEKQEEEADEYAKEDEDEDEDSGSDADDEDEDSASDDDDDDEDSASDDDDDESTLSNGESENMARYEISMEFNSFDCSTMQSYEESFVSIEASFASEYSRLKTFSYNSQGTHGSISKKSSRSSQKVDSGIEWTVSGHDFITAGDKGTKEPLPSEEGRSESEANQNLAPSMSKRSSSCRSMPREGSRSSKEAEAETEPSASGHDKPTEELKNIEDPAPEGKDTDGTQLLTAKGDSSLLGKLASGVLCSAQEAVVTAESSSVKEPPTSQSGHSESTTDQRNLLSNEKGSKCDSETDADKCSTASGGKIAEEDCAEMNSTQALAVKGGSLMLGKLAAGVLCSAQEAAETEDKGTDDTGTNDTQTLAVKGGSLMLGKLAAGALCSAQEAAETEDKGTDDTVTNGTQTLAVKGGSLMLNKLAAGALCSAQEAAVLTESSNINEPPISQSESLNAQESRDKIEEADCQVALADKGGDDAGKDGSMLGRLAVAAAKAETVGMIACKSMGKSVRLVAAKAGTAGTKACKSVAAPDLDALDDDESSVEEESTASSIDDDSTTASGEDDSTAATDDGDSAIADAALDMTLAGESCGISKVSMKRAAVSTRFVVSKAKAATIAATEDAKTAAKRAYTRVANRLEEAKAKEPSDKTQSSSGVVIRPTATTESTNGTAVGTHGVTARTLADLDLVMADSKDATPQEPVMSSNSNLSGSSNTETCLINGGVLTDKSQHFGENGQYERDGDRHKHFRKNFLSFLMNDEKFETRSRASTTEKYEIRNLSSTDRSLSKQPSVCSTPTSVSVKDKVEKGTIVDERESVQETQPKQSERNVASVSTKNTKSIRPKKKDPIDLKPGTGEVGTGKRDDQKSPTLETNGDKHPVKKKQNERGSMDEECQTLAKTGINPKNEKQNDRGGIDEVDDINMRIRRDVEEINMRIRRRALEAAESRLKQLRKPSRASAHIVASQGPMSIVRINKEGERKRANTGGSSVSEMSTSVDMRSKVSNIASVTSVKSRGMLSVTSMKSRGMLSASTIVARNAMSSSGPLSGSPSFKSGTGKKLILDESIRSKERKTSGRRSPVGNSVKERVIPSNGSTKSKEVKSPLLSAKQERREKGKNGSGKDKNVSGRSRRGSQLSDKSGGKTAKGRTSPDITLKEKAAPSVSQKGIRNRMRQRTQPTEKKETAVTMKVGIKKGRK